MPRSRWSWIVFSLLLATPPAARALDREYVLRWLPSAGQVNGYRVYLGAQGQPTQMLDLGAVTPDPDGIAREALQLDATKTFGVSMTAYNQAGESQRSNQITVPASTCDPAACNDGDPCTADDCQNLTCTHARLPDGSICGSGSICLAGACRVPQCTRDADCADGDQCDGVETCAGFACASGTALMCPAPGPCQQGGCAANAGCWSTALADGTPCNDSDPGTFDDQCRAGRCAGSSGCRADSECSDGNLCNGTETCAQGGACVAGTPPVCGGATQCADAMCSPSSGCAVSPKPEGTACDDGMASTSGDRCTAGQCRGTPVAGTPQPAVADSPRLRLTAITPGSVRLGIHHLSLTGTGFAPGMKLSLRSATPDDRQPWVGRVNVSSSQEGNVWIWSRPRMSSRDWDAVVTLPDGRTAVLPAGFRTDR